MKSPFPLRELQRVETGERQSWERHEEQLNVEVAALESQMAPRRAALREKFREERLAALPEAIRGDVKQALDLPAKQRNEVQKFLAEKFSPQFVLADDELSQLDAEYKTALAQHTTAAQAVQARRTPMPSIRALWDRGQPSPTYLLRRGDYRTPGDI